MSESTLKQKLDTINRQLEETNRLPVPTLEIIGQERREANWQSLLVYFLEKDNPHGFGTDVLAAFLRAVESHPQTTFDSGKSDIDQIKIQSEVPTGNGPVDLLLTLDDEWFLCIELKVGSPETGNQTVRYANAGSLGDLVASEFGGTGDYLYLAPESALEPSSKEFTLISWSSIVPYLEDVLREGHGQYPAKSTAQLADYLDTIKRELNMTGVNEISEETELYIEHYEMIDRLKDAFREDKEKLFRELKNSFFTEVDIDQEDWKVNNRPRGYIQFYKESWHQLDSGTGIEYEPHVQLKRDHPRILLRLDIEHENKHVIREEFEDRLGEEDLRKLEANDWEVTDGSFAYLAKPISIDVESPNESVSEAAQELHQLREIVEPHIEAIAATY